MFRRLTSGLVLASFVATQWAAMPHSHAPGTELPFDHSAIPHIHLSSGCCQSHHSHEHEAGCDDQHIVSTSGGESDLSSFVLRGVIGHDADVVYLPAPTTDSNSSGTNQAKIVKLNQLLLVSDVTPVLNNPVACLVTSYHQLNIHDSARPLWLTLRTLRI